MKLASPSLWFGLLAFTMGLGAYLLSFMP